MCKDYRLQRLQITDYKSPASVPDVRVESQKNKIRPSTEPCGTP